ncbi:DegQ family serine endoprotease [Aquabacterium sp. A7-Y]|uniref:DegQ family serine endoprotease n=1 Tax=Aquabacterium sp. A7-Y TaxID=1349605 RepID=UPI00223CD7C5|nr:DegQ family serine endoprotease [Aquabacterium sp. A7-Y]MCW7541806.1 DegQ family serine endoprotease [Aquabacterium sp. A7-Y]
MTARTISSGGLPSFRHAAASLLAAASLVLALPVPGHAQPGQGLPDFTELVERVGPSVVNIRTTERVRGGQGSAAPQMDEDMQEFFRRFFGVPLPGQPNPRQDPRRAPRPGQEEEQPRGVGSGFILTADGFVMTNAHVVEGADEVYVTLTDKREFKARIVGTDKRTDVAVVKIDAAGLPAVRVADVGKLKVGEWVMAIGSPFGLDNTVTAGIVSAKQRDTGDYLPFIQTDVAINPGNSGGPLLNLRGEVVGINSQIYSRSGGSIGISFAIPIDEAMRVADQLRATGRVVRGRIGVQIDQVTKEVAESLGLGKPIGAVVRSVEPGGPAEKAGVEAGDIITRFDGKTIERAAELPRIVGNSKPGSKLSLQVFRRGNYRDLSVTVAEIEPERPRRVSGSEPRASGPGAGAAAQSIGLAVSELSEAQQRELGQKGGVRVESAEGAAGRAGLREGDIILAVGNTEIKDTRQFETVLSRIDRSKPFNLLFRRGEWAQYAVIRPTR